MQNNYFHNNRTTEKSIEKKNIPHVKNINKKNVVDINRLLNRVRVEKKNETIRKIILLSSVFLALSIFLSFVLFLN